MIAAPLLSCAQGCNRLPDALVRTGLSLPAFCLLAFCVLTAVAAPAATRAADIIVDTAADETSADGDCSLREAVEAANTNALVDACAAGSADGDVITFSSAFTIALTGGELALLDDVAIDASEAAGVTIDAGGNSRLFAVQGRSEGDEVPGSEAAVAFRSLVLTGGDASDGSGGAVHVGAGGEVTFTDVEITGSAAGGNGGGLYAASGTDVSISGGEIAGNTAGTEGGGLWTGGTLTASGGLSVTGNTAAGNANNDGGGGIFANGGGSQVTLDTVFVEGNAAGGTHGRGGGLNIYYGASLVMTGGAISGNSAPGAGGGGITVQGSSATLTAVTVDGNGSGVGGGLYVEDGDATVRRSTFSGNTAGYGGGLHARGSATLDIDRSTVSQNEASTGDGGGGYISGDAPVVTLTSATVTANSASGAGGGLAGGGENLTLGNTIVAGNTAGGTGADCTGALTSNGFNLVGDLEGCTLEGDTESNVTGRGPDLGPLADNGGPTRTHLPRGRSPVVDAGSAPGEADVDQRGPGFERPQDHPDAENTGDGTDIGAVEAASEPESVPPNVARGTFHEARYRPDAGLTAVEGGRFYADGRGDVAGQLTHLQGIFARSWVGSSGLDVESQIGVVAQAQNDGGGVTDVGQGLHAVSRALNGGTITDAYGVRVDVWAGSGGAMTNAYKLFLGESTGSANIENQWGLYAGDREDTHYLAGNVGIGTQTPEKRLTVDGTVGATEVVVQPEWADFVFEEGYDLPELDDVRAHIGKRGHLPGIPSAEEVEQEGVRLGEMEAKLLQKIEELTLYAIEQEERTDTLKARLEAQKKRLGAQEKRIEQLLRRVGAGGPE